MPRKPRLHVPGGFYHVILRGNSRSDIFVDASDRRLWESILMEALVTYQQHLHAYCWMTNHVHLAMQTGEIALGRFVGALACRYAKAFNKKYGRSGHLFERRHRAVLVESDEQLLQLVRYIHQNPLRAKMVETLSDYLWSSHSVYAGAETSSFVTTNFVLSLLGQDMQTAREHYLKFVGVKPAASELKRLRNNQCNTDRLSIEKTQRIQVIGSKRSPSDPETLEQLMKRHCSASQFSLTELQSPSRCRELSTLRTKIALEATDRGLATVTELARLFNRSQPALSRSMNLLRRRMNKL